MAEDDVVFQEAVEALREGKKARARELLTGLLKSNQNNAAYWVWLSATMDTPKERIYCLQTALKLEPENASARRGLILHGALPPDDTIPPFPVNRPRSPPPQDARCVSLPKVSMPAPCTPTGATRRD